MRVLVVGGAGYIGSHCVRQLLRAGHEPVVVDNLGRGHRSAVSAEVPFYAADLGDRERISAVLGDERIEAVMHFAAFTYTGESVEKPVMYYENNVVQTLRLLRAMLDRGVGRFVFSSTCATYGEPETMPIREDALQRPINPYGQTKLDVENLLRNLASAHGLASASFRYFNAAGAAADGSIGEHHDPETHLIPLAIAAACGKGPGLQIFGTDYETPDGTCLRDYTHVDDLSRAHIQVLPRLDEPGSCLFYNLGTGRPHSVREVIAAVERVSGSPVPTREVARRAGDPPVLYADSSKAVGDLGWEIEVPELAAIVGTAWRWHRDHPDGYAPE